MAALENLVRDQKVRFLASDILFKGAPQTLEDVCTDCRLFPVTRAELLEFTSLPVKIGDFHATALCVPFPGSIYVTEAFCQEIGKKSILTSFSVYQNRGGNWLRRKAPVTPTLPDFEKYKRPSRPVIGEASICQVPVVDQSTPLLSTPPVGKSHVPQCPGIEPALTHAGIPDRKDCVQSNGSYLPMTGRSSLSLTREVDKTTAFLAPPDPVRTQFSRRPSNCEYVSSQGPTNDGVVHQGGASGLNGLLQRKVDAMSSTCGVHMAYKVSPALGPVAAGRRSVTRRDGRPKAGQKLERRDGPPEVEEVRAAQNSEVSSRVTRSASGNLPEGEMDSPEKKREREPHDSLGDKETSVERKRGRKKELMVPDAEKEATVEGEFTCLVHPNIHAVSRLELRGLEHSEVVCETRISLSGTDKSGGAELGNPVQVSVRMIEEAGPPPKRKRKSQKARVCIAKPTRKASSKRVAAKDVTINPSPVLSLSTPGLTCNQLMHGPGPVVGGAVHLEVIRETRVISLSAEEAAGKQLEHRENCSKSEQKFAGKFDQPQTCPSFYGGTNTVTSRRFEKSSTPVKSTGCARAHMLYVSDLDKNSSKAELPQADVKVATDSPTLMNPNGSRDSLLHLSAELPGAENRSQDTEMMQMQSVRRNVVNPLEVELVTGTELASRAGSLQHLTCINDYLRVSNAILTSYAAENIGGACSTGLSSLGEKDLKLTEIQLCANLPRDEFPNDSPGGISGSGYSIAANRKQPNGQMEHSSKHHMSTEYVHYDGDEFAAHARKSPVVQVEHIQAMCNSGEIVVMCVEPEEDIIERNAHLHTGATADGLNTKGAILGAAEERPVSGSKFPQYEHQHLGISRPTERLTGVVEDVVHGVEPCTSSRISQEMRPIVYADHAVVPGVSRGVMTEEVILNLNGVIPGAPLVHAAPVLEAKCFPSDMCAESSCAMDLVGFCTVSESVVISKGTPDGPYSSTGEDPCSRKVLSDEEQRKGLSRIERQPEVSAVPQKEATSSYVVSSTRNERPEMVASPDKPDLDTKFKHVQGYPKMGSPAVKGKVCFVPMEPSKVGVEEGTHVRRSPGEILGYRHFGGRSENGREIRLVDDALHVEVDNSENHLPQEIVKETIIGGLGRTKNHPSAEKKLLALELGSLTHVSNNGTRDRNADSANPGNKAGTFLGKNSREHISREVVAVQETLVPTSVRIIDAGPKQKNQGIKTFPEFDNYTVIGEEGSGGYGTVYRVVNNATDSIYAMKCPLLKTHPSCVENEISMLKQLGGKECIIKFETVVPGRFRTVSDSGEKLSECKSILLEFMEHDKPEILKKEITIEELRNYSTCLFRALAHMHRKKVMHLDVKPGNFLFSRSKKRGYLVDFNLARDEQKQQKRIKKILPISSHISSRVELSRRSSKRPPAQDVVSTPVSYSKRSRLLMGASGTQLSYGTPSPAKTLPVLQDQNKKFICHGISADAKLPSPRLPDLAPSRSTTTMGARSSPRRTVESPKPGNEHGDPGGAHPQCEGSADVLKNQTLGPRPQSGHRALLKYIQTKVYNQPPPVFTPLKSSLPASQRKRVAAVQNKRKVVTAGTVPVTQQTSQPSIARKLKAPGKPKGYNDHLKDGPCVGTKGYRAPEVLLRSLKQTTKVDIWSAGVSLLQLVSGRSPFPSTSTEGALKDIAKIRGSDKVLALATRHQRQHSISKEFCAMRYSPISLKEWCEKHSKRPDLKGRIPPELFDLLEKCLDVDPISRITAEEALNHQFCSTLNDKP